MSLDGFISSSVLFHDKDGTAALKVVSLASAESYGSGKVAIVTGTCGTSLVSVDFSQYKTAAGEDFDIASVTSVDRLAFSSDSAATMKTSGSLPAMTVGSKNNQVCVVSNPGFSVASTVTSTIVQVSAVTGTSNYSVILLGS